MCVCNIIYTCCLSKKTSLPPTKTFSDKDSEVRNSFKSKASLTLTKDFVGFLSPLKECQIQMQPHCTLLSCTYKSPANVNEPTNKA